MSRAVALFTIILLAAVVAPPAEAQRLYSTNGQSYRVNRPVMLPSQQSNTSLQAFRRGNNFYVVPFRRPVYVPVPSYAPLYPTYSTPYRSGYYSAPFTRVIITRSPAPGQRAVPNTSHYFGPPHASQYTGNPHASQYRAN